MTVDLGAVVTRLQSHYIRGASPRQVFDTLLPELLALTGSSFGFVAEVWRDAGGPPYLKVFNLTDIAWDEATRRHVEQQRDSGLEFRNLDSLLGAAVLTQQPVISNDPANDPRRAGLPPGHPPLHAYLGVPLLQGGALVGVIGLANRPGGYDEALVRLLQPLFGTVGFMLGQLQTDRERRAAEEALRHSEALYRATFENAAIGIARLDAEGRFVEVNARLGDILGRTPDTLRGLHLHEVVQAEDRPAGLALLSALRSGTLPRLELEQRFLRPDGGIVWGLLALALLPDARGGAPPHLLVTVQDISERQQLEGARVAAQAADRANRAKTEFLSRMSHELRTPLNAVLGFAQLLRMNGRDPLTPGQSQQVQHIERAGQHLLAMINDVLDLSRIEEGALAMQLAPLAVDGAVQEALVLLQTAAADAGVALQVDGGPPLRVRADAQRLRQVLVNLLSNAVKYNRRGGRVMVAWSLDEGRCRIDVSDTGVGLSEVQRVHLFEPFNRLGAERGQVEGAGIGLVITRRLLQLMQGDLRVRSTPGQGSCFSVLLPAAAPVAAVPAQGLPEDEDTPAPVTDAVVLYVEDNRLNQELLRQVLRLRPALKLLCAETGERALALARRHMPQLLLIDWHLGDMDGAQVLRRLRNEAGLEACPAVVLSADATRERQEAALRAGFDAYLTKPFGVADLLSCLDRLVGPPPTSGFMALR